MAQQIWQKTSIELTARSSTRLARVAVMLTTAMLLAACGPERKVSVRSACDVFTDSLLGVDATTPDGNRRLANHYESGITADCWKR